MLHVFLRLLTSLVVSTLSLLFLLWLVLVAIVAWNGGNVIDATEVLSYMLIKPSDLYDKYCEIKVDVAINNAAYTQEFKIKYLGNHFITLELGKNYNEIRGFPSEKLSLVIKITSGGQVLMSTALSAEDLKKKGWGYSYGGSPYCILEWLDVPEDLPKNEPLLLNVTVLNPDVELDKLYGPVKVGIRKTSDL